MGANARITGLATIQDAEEATLFETLSMVLDDPTYIGGNAKQMRVATLASNRDVPDNTTLGNKFVTEQGLMKTLATTSKKGLVRLATDPEVIAQTPNVALCAGDFPLAIDTYTAPSYYDYTNVGYILDHITPTQTEFTPAININAIGALNVLSGNFYVAFTGSAVKMDIWFKGMRKPAAPVGVSASVSDAGTLRSCGAIIDASGAFTVMSIHSPVNLSGKSVFFNVTYTSV